VLDLAGPHWKAAELERLTFTSGKREQWSRERKRPNSTGRSRKSILRKEKFIAPISLISILQEKFTHRRLGYRKRVWQATNLALYTHLRWYCTFFSDYYSSGVSGERVVTANNAARELREYLKHAWRPRENWWEKDVMYRRSTSHRQSAHLSELNYYPSSILNSLLFFLILLSLESNLNIPFKTIASRSMLRREATDNWFNVATQRARHVGQVARFQSVELSTRGGSPEGVCLTRKIATGRPPPLKIGQFMMVLGQQGATAFSD